MRVRVRVRVRVLVRMRVCDTDQLSLGFEVYLHKIRMHDYSIFNKNDTMWTKT